MGKSKAFSMAHFIWIVMQIISIYMDSSVSIRQNTETTSEFNNETSQRDEKIDFYSILSSHNHSSSNTLNSKTTVKSIDLETQELVTVSTSEHGEFLGTPAAYKLDIRDPLIGCSLSEFACKNSKCVPASKFCDKINDCGDNSDEPRFCTRKSCLFDSNTINLLNYLR